jgi:hypothetical protein
VRKYLLAENHSGLKKGHLEILLDGHKRAYDLLPLEFVALVGDAIEITLSDQWVRCQVDTWATIMGTGKGG